jgi:hypothetical protein
MSAQPPPGYNPQQPQLPGGAQSLQSSPMQEQPPQSPMQPPGLIPEPGAGGAPTPFPRYREQAGGYSGPGDMLRHVTGYMGDRMRHQNQQAQQQLPGGGLAPPPGGIEQWRAYQDLRSPYGKSGRKAQAPAYMAYQDKYGGGFDPSNRFVNAKMNKYIEKLRRKGGT